MRRILCLVLSVLIIMTFAGCGQKQSSTPAKDSDSSGTAVSTEKQVLRIVGESWQVTKLFLEEAAKAFEKDHPDVKVDIQTYSDPTVVSNYAIDWSGGTTPVDLVVIDGAQFVQQFVTKNLIYDFEKDLDFFKDFDRSAFVPSALDMSRINGNLYVIPLISELTVVNVNTKMFRDAGLVDGQNNPLVPSTWKEFYDFAKEMTVRDSNNVVTQQGATIQLNKDIHGTVLGVLQASNGTIYGPDGISIDFDNKAFHDVLEIWKAGIADGSFSSEVFADTEAGRNGYKAGKIGMLIESSGRWVEAGNEIGFENVSVFPLPGTGGTAGYVNGVFIPKTTKAADLAAAFTKEQLLGEFAQTSTLNQYGKLPVITKFFDMADSSDWANIKASMSSACTYPAYQDSSKLLDEMRVIIQEGLLSNDKVEVTIQKLQSMIASLRK